MTKIDEKARVPKVGAAERERLSEALDVEGVVAVMLVGSRARGNPGPLSDLDIAYWHEPSLDPPEASKLNEQLTHALTRVSVSAATSPVALNNQPALVRHRAIRDGVRLIERDHDERIRLETRAVLEHCDLEAWRAGLEAHFEDG